MIKPKSTLDDLDTGFGADDEFAVTPSDAWPEIDTGEPGVDNDPFVDEGINRQGCRGWRMGISRQHQAGNHFQIAALRG